MYLPAEDLERFGAAGAAPAGDPEPTAAGPGDGADGDRLVALIEFEAERAFGWYATGLRLLPLLDRRSAACAGAMAGIYLRLLERIVADPRGGLRAPAVAARQGEGHGRGARRWPVAAAPPGAGSGGREAAGGPATQRPARSS